MKSNEALWEICMKIYRKMYKEATPSANFDELIKKGITKKHDWFSKYYLNEDRQEQIIDEICKKHKLTKYEKHLVSVEVHLGCSPSVVKR